MAKHMKDIIEQTKNQNNQGYHFGNIAWTLHTQPFHEWKQVQVGVYHIFAMMFLLLAAIILKPFS